MIKIHNQHQVQHCLHFTYSQKAPVVVVIADRTAYDVYGTATDRNCLEGDAENARKKNPAPK